MFYPMTTVLTRRTCLILIAVLHWHATSLSLSVFALKPEVKAYTGIIICGEQSVMLKTRVCRCIRCGLSDTSSAQACAFHPSLLPDPGPLRFTPEWYACQAAGHTLADPPCYSRPEHYLCPAGQVCPAGDLSKSPDSETHAARRMLAQQDQQQRMEQLSPMPRPRIKLPQPSTYH